MCSAYGASSISGVVIMLCFFCAPNVAPMRIDVKSVDAYPPGTSFSALLGVGAYSRYSSLVRTEIASATCERVRTLG